MRFLQWLDIRESNFMQLPDEIREKLHKVAEKIIVLKRQHDINSIEQKINDYKQRGHLGLPIDTITLTDIRGNLINVNVCVASTRKRAFYSPRKQSLVIDYSSFQDDNDIFRALSHEIGHALGTPRKTSKEYKKYLRQRTNLPNDNINTNIHYTEPIEFFQAISVEMSSAIKEYYYGLSDENKPKLISDLEQWLRYGGELPDPLKRYNKYIENFKMKPKLWNIMRTKLFNLTNQLKSSMSNVSWFNNPAMQGQSNFVRPNNYTPRR